MLVKSVLPLRNSNAIKSFIHPKSFDSSALINSKILEPFPINSLINMTNAIFVQKPLTKIISHSFCSSSKPQLLKKLNQEVLQEENPSLNQILQQIKDKILATSSIKQQRIQQAINHRVEKQLQKNIKSLIRGKYSQEERIIAQSRQKINIHSSLIQNEEFMGQTQNVEDQRAMIMIRLQILWNEQYEELSIDQLIELIYYLESSKQLKNNELKSMTTIFLTVETLKKCILHPRIQKNIICSSKSIFQNLSSVKKGLEGQIKARENLQKVQILLLALQKIIEKKQNRMCYMKVQSNLNYLISQIFNSFHQPNLYNDKSVCLLTAPPRVIFDEPFHQEYDRFIEMAVLTLFCKKLKKQNKISQLETIFHIFQNLKIYQQNKLQTAYQKENVCSKEIRKLKSKVIKMDRRLRIIDWVNCYIKRNICK